MSSAPYDFEVHGIDYQWIIFIYNSQLLPQFHPPSSGSSKQPSVRVQDQKVSQVNNLKHYLQKNKATS